jgi:Transcriptional regulatory protein, C terminal
MANPADAAVRREAAVRSPESAEATVPAFLTKTIFLMEYRKVSSGYMTVGTQLVSRPETLDDLFSQSDADHGGYPWDEHVPPGRDGTLLAIVPIPGTNTSLAIVGYAIATTSGATSGATPNGATTAGAMTTAGGHQVRPAESDSAPEGHADADADAGVGVGVGVRLDHVQRRAWAGGREIMLTFQEFQLLAFLTAHPAKVFSRADLVEQVWHRDTAPAGRDTARDTARDARTTARDARTVARDSRTVDVHVSRLRHKLGPVYGRSLVTEYRVGYQFRPPAA